MTIPAPQSPKDLINALLAYLATPDSHPSYRTHDQGGTQGCVYRHEDGHRCFFGLFIPDELYDRDFEGDPATALIKKDGPLAAFTALDLPPPPDPYQAHDVFWAVVQSAHDDAAFRWAKHQDVKRWRKQAAAALRDVAAEFRITL